MSQQLVNVEDYRKKAKRQLPRIIFDYLDGGAEDENGLDHNKNIFRKWKFIPKRLVDISDRDISCNIFNKKWNAPIAIAPTGLNGTFWPKGDLVLAKSAAKANIPFILSTASNLSLEEIAKSSDGEKWFQLYVLNKQIAFSLIQRALKAGYTTLIVTLDVGVNGNRERDIRNNFKLPLKITPSLLLDGIQHPAWMMRFIGSGMPQLANFITAEAHNIEQQKELMNRQMDTTFNLKSLKEIRELWPYTLVVKGIICPRDVENVIQCGVDGIILSNHGGRQIDECISPMETLHNIPHTTAVPLLIDSGFRRGSDIVKALCLGADMVCLGRATLYGLAAKGEAGVDEVIQLIKQEINCTLAQIGCPSIDSLGMKYIY